MSQPDALSLEGTVVAVAADGGHRFSKQTRDRIVLLEGHGVEGDAHAGPFVRHRYLARRRPRAPNLRQVHLIPSELFRSLSEAGFVVAAGDLVVVLEAMKMEQPLVAHRAGTITGLSAEVGATVTSGSTLCEIVDA